VLYVQMREIIECRLVILILPLVCVIAKNLCIYLVSQEASYLVCVSLYYNFFPHFFSLDFCFLFFMLSFTWSCELATVVEFYLLSYNFIIWNSKN